MVDEEHAFTRRQAIIAAAEAVFDARGYAATTIDEVAAKASIAKGSVYNYFKSKEDLFEQVFDSAIGRFEAQALEMLSQPVSATEKIGRLLDFRFECLRDTEHMGRLFLEAWATAAREQQGHVAEFFRRIADSWRQRIAEVLAQGVAAGEFNLQFPPAFGAALILALMDGIEIEALLGFEPGLDERYRTAMKTAVLTALKSPKEQLPIKS